MTTISFHFYRGTSLISRLIQLRTFSQFSHCSVQIGDTIWEAKERIGVRKVGVKQPPKSLVDTLSFDISSKDAFIIKSWMFKQLGKKYDYWGVLGMVGRPKKRKKDDRYFCSEFASEVCYRLKIKQEEKITLSPGAFYLLLK